MSAASTSHTSDPKPFPLLKVLRQDARLIANVDAALADAAQRAGSHLACRPGCTQCCHGVFAISQLDALRLRNGLAALAVSAPRQASAIVGRARQFLAEFRHDFPGDIQTGILGTSEEDQAAFDDFANEAPCPALDPESGLCDLYSARPMTCRTFGPPVKISQDAAEEGFAVCELCFTTANSEEIAAAEMIVPYDEEQNLAAALAQARHEPAGETIIACCLAQPLSPPTETS
jgi:Fe-S-cluster containining protein